MTIEQTIEQTKESIRIMQAFVDGKDVESMHDGKWAIIHVPRWNWENTKYRIAPTSTLRPWAVDEVPLGAWMREKKVLHDRRILGWTSNQADRAMWLDEWEHSTDCGKTWLPCGVMEESK